MYSIKYDKTLRWEIILVNLSELKLITRVLIRGKQESQSYKKQDDDRSSERYWKTPIHISI